jgi:PAS domain S-box-containing protein
VNDPQAEPWRDLLRIMGLRSTASSPIRVGSRVFGAFSLGAAETAFFDQAGMELLEELASDVGFALQAIEDRAARQVNEAALAEQQRLFQRVADLTPALLYLFDLQTGRSVYLNRSAVELLALSDADSETVSAEEIVERMHPDDRSTVPRWTDRFIAAADEMVESEYRLRGRDGTWHWLHSQDVVFARGADGRARLVLGVAQDITVRRLAEEALRKSEAQFRAVFDNAAAGIVISTIDGRIVRANAAACRMLGYALEELQGLSRDHISNSDDLARESALIDDLRAGLRPSYTIEKQYVAKDGRIVWATLTISIIHDSPGVPAYVLALIDDISERRLLQEQFQQSQKMESIGRLAGGVAHDFNNLLTAIMGYAEMLRADLPLDHAGQAFVDEISKAGSRAASLTTQLLAFARRQVISPRALDLNGVVKETEQMLRRIIGEDIDLDVQLQSPLGTVHADVGQLQQILLNLTVNARDAMPHGGRIVIETANTRLDDTYARTHPDVEVGDYVMLVFSDTGLGMPRDVQEHAFEPFFTTKERGKGTGLGLATCHGIVKQAGGHIHVYSEPGLGTTFRIYLPRVRDAIADEALAVPLPPLRRGHETVLLAEDEPAVRNLASLSLRAHGYTVIEAHDGAAALTAAQAHAGRIRLLVTDVVMPGMNGPDLAARFRPLCPDAQVLFISGHAESAIVHQGVLEAGVAFLPKPFTPERLARRVREMLDRGAA